MTDKMKNNQGFTLIEVVLGLSLFALTALTFYTIFANGMRINTRAANNEQLYRELRWSVDALARDLENMVPYEGFNGKNAFQGDEKNLSLILPTAKGLKVVRYSLTLPDTATVLETRVGEHTAKNKQIVVNYTQEEKIELLVREESEFSEPGEGQSAAVSEPEVLSAHVQPDSLKFSYGYRTDGQDPEIPLAWKNEWTDVHFPAAVRIEVNLLEADQPTPLMVKKDVLIPLGSWSTQK